MLFVIKNNIKMTNEIYQKSEAANQSNPSTSVGRSELLRAACIIQ